MDHFDSFASAYRGGLRDVLDDGAYVPSVLDAWSKASGFGKDDRPYRESIGHSFAIDDPLSSLVSSEVLPVNLAYCFGLLAWSLDGRNDLQTPAFYRGGANEYSDDQHTLSGAFGNRLLSSQFGGNQMDAIVDRIQRDPTHRRTFAMVLDPSDNFRQSREYPCAVGVQLFLRDDKLTWLTVMRAQQALTVLPYDAFLFMLIQQWVAARLDVACGPYIHNSGTFHFYEKEAELAAQVAAEKVEGISLPQWPSGAAAAQLAADELIAVERDLREAVAAGAVDAIGSIAKRPVSCELVEVARGCLATHAFRKVGDARSLVEAPAATGRLRDLMHTF